MIKGVHELNAVLDSRRYAGLEKQFRLIDGEKHGGMKCEGLNRGLRHVFGKHVKS